MVDIFIPVIDKQLKQLEVLLHWNSKLKAMYTWTRCPVSDSPSWQQNKLNEHFTVWINAVYIQFKMWLWTWWSVVTDLQGVDSWICSSSQLYGALMVAASFHPAANGKQTQLETSWWTSRSHILPAGFVEPLHLSGAQMHDIQTNGNVSVYLLCCLSCGLKHPSQMQLMRGQTHPSSYVP